MKEFYEEGIKIGEVKFDKVLVANEQIRQIDDTLINRCLSIGIEIIAMEDKDNNKVKYVSCRRPKDPVKGELNWKVAAGGIMRFWNVVNRVCSEFGMAKSS